MGHSPHEGGEDIHPVNHGRRRRHTPTEVDNSMSQTGRLTLGGGSGRFLSFFWHFFYFFGSFFIFLEIGTFRKSGCEKMWTVVGFSTFFKFVSTHFLNFYAFSWYSSLFIYFFWFSVGYYAFSMDSGHNCIEYLKSYMIFKASNLFRSSFQTFLYARDFRIYLFTLSVFSIGYYAFI